MLDDFFIRALIAGSGLALIAGPLGCFVVWRRMSYFGDTMSHAALLGVAMALLFDFAPVAGVFAIAVLVSVTLLFLQKLDALPSDALLGILSHSALALGLVLVSFMTSVRIDLPGLLFGDVLAVSREDIVIVYAGGLVIAALLAMIWRPLLALTVSADIAQAEGLHVERARFVFVLLVAGLIAMAIKIVGIILITALLIIPAATARRFAASPEKMALIAALTGTAAVIAGLFGSLHWDTPSGPSIVTAAFAIFVLGLWPARLGR